LPAEGDALTDITGKEGRDERGRQIASIFTRAVSHSALSGRSPPQIAQLAPKPSGAAEGEAPRR